MLALMSQKNKFREYRIKIFIHLVYICVYKLQTFFKKKLKIALNKSNKSYIPNHLNIHLL